MRLVGVVVLGVLAAACSHAPPPARPVETEAPAVVQAPEPKGHVHVETDTHVEILDPIKFFVASPAIDPRSTPILDAVASTLTGNPSIKVVEVIAYGADAVPSLQQSVALARAQAVVAELVARGVDQKRLRASGEAVPTPGNGPGPTFLILKRDP
jgi:outer membrane protein OmpA-like peptidoglycan-associated protein